METLKNQVFDALTASEADWKISKYYAQHNPSGVRWWIGSGIFFFYTDGENSVSLGFWNWVKLFYWIKNAQRKHIIRSVKK